MLLHIFRVGSILVSLVFIIYYRILLLSAKILSFNGKWYKIGRLYCPGFNCDLLLTKTRFITAANASFLWGIWLAARQWCCKLAISLAITKLPDPKQVKRIFRSCGKKTKSVHHKANYVEVSGVFSHHISFSKKRIIYSVSDS